MTQRGVEIALARLVTDESIRRRFQKAPRLVLRELIALGVDLSARELRSLESLEPTAVHAFADALDTRLEKAELAGAG